MKVLNKQLISMSIALSVAACGGGGTTSSTASNNTPAHIVFVSPSNGARTMPINPNIYISFDKPLSDAQSKSDYLSKFQLINESGNIVPTSTILSATKKTAFIQLSAPLSNGAKYSLMAPSDLMTDQSCGITCAAKTLTTSATKENTPNAQVLVSEAYVMSLGFLGVYLLSHGIPSNFVYVANTYFKASEYCANGYEDACFGTSSGIAAGNWMCETDTSNPDDGGVYSAFLTDTEQPTNYLNESVLRPDDVYAVYDKSADIIAPLFYTEGNGQIASGEIVYPEDASIPSFNWLYWTGANATGQPSDGNCLNWSINSYYPTNSGYGATGEVGLPPPGEYYPASFIYNNSGATYGCGIYDDTQVHEFPLLCIEQPRSEPVIHGLEDLDPPLVGRRKEPEPTPE